MADLQYCDLLYLALEMYDTMTLWFIFKTHSSALIDKIQGSYNLTFSVSDSKLYVLSTNSGSFNFGALSSGYIKFYNS